MRSTHEFQKHTENIARLNEEGIALTGPKHSNNYAAAFGKHLQALSLAEQAKGFINPDYAAFTIANLVYAARKEHGDRNISLNMINNGLQKLEDFFADAEIRTRFDQTYFGQARLLEEKGVLLNHLKSKENPEVDLQKSITCLEDAIGLYKLAEVNPDTEIMTKVQLKNRGLRTHGLAASSASDLSEYLVGDKRIKMLNFAIDYAQRELNGRISAHESNTAPLMNAYHTLGRIQSEFAGINEEMYDKSRKNLKNALVIAHNIGDKVNFSVLPFRMAWLEYIHNSHDKQVITVFLNSALASGLNPEAQWGADVKAFNHAKLMELGKHLGLQMQKRAEAFLS